MAEVMEIEISEGKMWKTEPQSPEQCAPDYWDIDRLLEETPVPYGEDTITGDRAEIATKLLQDLDALVKEEDQQFPDWFEEKSNLPIFEVLPSLICDGNGSIIDQQQQQFCDVSLLKQQQPVLTSLDYQQPQQHYHLTQGLDLVDGFPSPIFVPVVESDTSQLLQEFENVLSETLTPPDSPREEDILTLLQGMNESSDLDALVASRVDNAYVKAGSSGANSPGCASACGGEESDFSTPASDSGCEDPDWLPSGTESPRDDPDWVIHKTPGHTTGGPAPKRKKTASGGRAPYSRSGAGPDERKQRKKEQNKNAATRYRQKKKAEVEGILDEEKGLKSKNEELKLKVTDLQREIKYLKSLMRDVFRAKGLIK
ncbi:hypothetical protein AAG570_013730 [Ranatra chinensis]|uniref:BZIP domain-containing protein n=1 Tax=Ranatra chinensis TaxID=642074 RepID=A0ABD0YD24_9HEMI